MKIPNIDYGEAIKSPVYLKIRFCIICNCCLSSRNLYSSSRYQFSCFRTNFRTTPRGNIRHFWYVLRWCSNAYVYFYTWSYALYFCIYYYDTNAVIFWPFKSSKGARNTGKEKIQQYTRYLTILLGLFQSYGISNGILNLSDSINPTLGSVAFSKCLQW